MNRSTGRRARLGGLLALALGAVALLALPALAAARDRNHDHIPDRWEKRHHLSLQVNQAHRDQDADQLQNLGEFQAGDNPQDPDSNNDGVEDGAENAGTIASYDAATGTLTIALFGGDSVTGTVTDQTHIVCGCDHGQAADGEGDDSASRPGEDQGPQQGPPPPSGPPGQGDDENGDPPGHDGTPPGASEGPGQGGKDGHHGVPCSAADLVVGAVVKEAELSLSDGTTFTTIALGKSEEGGDSDS